mmetsp:Transcript_72587/g.122166  ORF Transcript_72587/g.122166 Transcript_72587/m.122166 type:complete len:272 (+) Transcript_72587:2833-3648(+)
MEDLGAEERGHAGATQYGQEGVGTRPPARVCSRGVGGPGAPVGQRRQARAPRGVLGVRGALRQQQLRRHRGGRGGLALPRQGRRLLDALGRGELPPRARQRLRPHVHDLVAGQAAEPGQPVRARLVLKPPVREVLLDGVDLHGVRLRVQHPPQHVQALVEGVHDARAGGVQRVDHLLPGVRHRVVDVRGLRLPHDDVGVGLALVHHLHQLLEVHHLGAHDGVVGLVHVEVLDLVRVVVHHLVQLLSTSFTTFTIATTDNSRSPHRTGSRQP